MLNETINFSSTFNEFSMAAQLASIYYPKTRTENQPIVKIYTISMKFKTNFIDDMGRGTRGREMEKFVIINQFHIDSNRSNIFLLCCLFCWNLGEKVTVYQQFTSREKENFNSPFDICRKENLSRKYSFMMENMLGVKADARKVVIES